MEKNKVGCRIPTGFQPWRVFLSLAFLIATPLLGWLCDYNLMRASSEP
jgi:hypothetical protein